MGRVSLYFHTVKQMKPSQVLNRIGKKVGCKCSVGVTASESFFNASPVKCPEQLDFDPVFLARFPVGELMENKVTFLYGSKSFDWRSKWEFEDKSPLWNFNLHYFEYLFSLVKAWKDTGEKKYIDKTTEIIEGWIDRNPAGTQPAWAPYATALRIVNWISYYGYVNKALDKAFSEKFLKSLHSQYKYLSNHLEKDILGNHYFEDLKTLVIAALFFRDEALFDKALSDFRAECKEEILADGMHFELSPMYHKIIFEGMLRVALALRGAGKKDSKIESYLPSMLNVAYSFENGLERIPLFNDGGNNVAKSLEALIAVSGCFGLKPEQKTRLEDSGYYFFEKTVDRHCWKLIADAGQPGPAYIPGHAHCDAMSFELFCDGKPVIVNCGTYAYQCAERGFFRSTAAHNTVMIDGVEQSQCWGAFRMAGRSSTKVVEATDCSVIMEMTDQKGNCVKRSIFFSESDISVKDTSEKPLTAFVHLTDQRFIKEINSKQNYIKSVVPYAECYGKKNDITALSFSGAGEIELNISLAAVNDNNPAL